MFAERTENRGEDGNTRGVGHTGSESRSRETANENKSPGNQPELVKLSKNQQPRFDSAQQPRFDSAQRPTESITTDAEIKQALSEIFPNNKNVWERLQQSTEIITSEQLPNELTEKNAQAYFNPENQKIYLISDRIKKGTEKGVWLHEVFHKRGEELIGRKNLDNLYKSVENWKNLSTDTKARKVYEVANNRAANSNNYQDELVAYAIEELVNLKVIPNQIASPDSVSGWLYKVYQLVRRALVKLTNGANAKIDGQDLVSIAYGVANLEYAGLSPTFEELPQIEKSLQEIVGNEPILSENKKRIISKAAREYLKPEISFNQQLNDGTLSKRSQKDIQEIIDNFKILQGEERNSQVKKYIQAVKLFYKGLIDTAHKRKNLNFTAMPIADFHGKNTLPIYKSKVYNNRQSSEYRLVMIGDKPAYARKSNHWGFFTTNIYEGSEEAIKRGLVADERSPDIYGRVGLNSHMWNLVGGNESAKTSQAGYVLLEDLLKADQLKETNTSNVENVKHSVSPDTKTNYEQRIDELFDGKPVNRKGIKVLDSSDVLGMLGYEDKYIRLNEGKVVDGQNKHNLTAADWKKIPQWIEDPAAVFESETVEGRLVFIAPETVRGAPVLVIIEPQGENLNAHLLVNAYDAQGKRTPFLRWYRDGLTRYYNKKKFRSVVAEVGLRLPETAFLNKPGIKRILTQNNLEGYRKYKKNDIRFSITPKEPSSANKEIILQQSNYDYTEGQRKAFRAAGWVAESSTISSYIHDRYDQIKEYADKRMEQHIFDQFAPVKDLSRKAYSMLRLSKGAAGAFEAIMKHGKLSIRDGVFDADTSGGVIEKLIKSAILP